MSFATLATGGKYTQELRALIGTTHQDVNRIGYRATPRVSGWDYSYSISGSSTIANISYKDVSHSTLILQDNGEKPVTIQPYTVVHFWKRTS